MHWFYLEYTILSGIMNYKKWSGFSHLNNKHHSIGVVSLRDILLKTVAQISFLTLHEPELGQEWMYIFIRKTVSKDKYNFFLVRWLYFRKCVKIHVDGIHKNVVDKIFLSDCII